jgi:hypothetical protein
VLVPLATSFPSGISRILARDCAGSLHTSER